MVTFLAFNVWIAEFLKSLGREEYAEDRECGRCKRKDGEKKVEDTKKTFMHEQHFADGRVMPPFTGPRAPEEYPK